MSNPTSLVAADLRFVAHPGGPPCYPLCGLSTFWSVFEEECEALGLPLKVLPPRSPELNGIVEAC